MFNIIATMAERVAELSELYISQYLVRTMCYNILIMIIHFKGPNSWWCWNWTMPGHPPP